MTRALVLGIGTPERGDDGVGPQVAAAVARRGLPGVDVVVSADPLDLFDAGVEDVDLVVLVDAVRSGEEPGTVLLRDLAREPVPPPAGAASTHALGLDATVELARAMQRMPRRLLLVGVEAGAFGAGSPLSPAVAAAVRTAADAAIGLIERLTAPPGAAEHARGG